VGTQQQSRLLGVGVLTLKQKFW